MKKKILVFFIISLMGCNQELPLETRLFIKNQSSKPISITLYKNSAKVIIDAKVGDEVQIATSKGIISPINLLALEVDSLEIDDKSTKRICSTKNDFYKVFKEDSWKKSHTLLLSGPPFLFLEKEQPIEGYTYTLQ
jgi:hypothetical protein